MNTERLPTISRKGKSIVAFAAILVAAVFAAGCAGGERAAQSQPAEDEAANESAAAERKAEDGTEREGEDVRSEARDGGDEARAGEVGLRIGGDEGTTFSGKCAVGDDEEEVSGEVPRSFAYRLDGGELECEITNKGPGALEVTLRSGNDRSVHRTNTPDAVINLTYSENGVSSSTTSSSSGSMSQSSSSVSSSSINQQSSNSIVSSSSSVNQQSSSPQSSSQNSR